MTIASSSALPKIASLEEAHKAGRLVVSPLSRLLDPQGITLPLREDPVLALFQDPPARGRGARLAPNAVPPNPEPLPAKRPGGVQPMPEWEGGEHTYLGNHVILKFDGESGPASKFPLNLDNGLALTYGQVVSLGGDFYGLPDAPISDDPHPPERFNRAYQTLAVAQPAVPEVPKILAVMQIEINAVNQAIREGRQPSTAYKALGDDLSGQWNVITGGGSLVSDFVPLGRYLNLAATNWDHFGTHAITCYTVGHGVAMQAAIAAKAQTDASIRRIMLQRAYAMNAFADHYLSDIFSSGHMRTPRKELYQTVTPSSVGSLLSRFMHDEDSAYGLAVQNARGSKWTAYGDKRLLDTVNTANLQMVQQALQVSADEIWNAYQSGTAGTNEALKYVANLEVVSNRNNTANPSPLFTYANRTTERRTNPAHRFDYTWTSDWWGSSTYYLLSHLPEFENMGDGSIPVTLDTEILQLWNNGGNLGLIQYGIKGSGYGVHWSTPNTGQGSAAVQYLAADFWNKGTTDLMQMWNNGGVLGMIRYAPNANGVGYNTAWTNNDMGQSSNAVQWLVVDCNGDGQNQIIQCCNNSGTLGMLLYAPDPAGPGFINTWNRPNMGQGPGALQWLVVDRTGDGKSELLQLWNNGGSLGMILYGPDGNGGYVKTWNNSNMGQGSSAVQFIPVDFDGDGKTHVVQCWNNNGTLAMILYSPDPNGSGYITRWTNGNMGQGPSAVQWFPVKVGGNSSDHILQCWNNRGNLAMILYSPTHENPGYSVRWSSPDMGEGSAAVAWLAAATGADDAMDIIQLWNNGGTLGMIVYSPSILQNNGYKLNGHIDSLGEGSSALAFFSAETLAPADGID